MKIAASKATEPKCTVNTSPLSCYKQNVLSDGNKIQKTTTRGFLTIKSVILALLNANPNATRVLEVENLM